MKTLQIAAGIKIGKIHVQHSRKLFENTVK